MAAIKATGTLKGADGVRDALRRLNRAIQGASPEAVAHLARMIIAEAQSRTPVDTGALRASAYVDAPQVSISGRYTTIDFGFAREGRPVDYALIQHENDSYYHPVGEAHFLLNAIESRLPVAKSLIARIMRIRMEEEM